VGHAVCGRPAPAVQARRQRGEVMLAGTRMTRSRRRLAAFGELGVSDRRAAGTRALARV